MGHSIAIRVGRDLPQTASLPPDKRTDPFFAHLHSKKFRRLIPRQNYENSDPAEKHPPCGR